VAAKPVQFRDLANADLDSAADYYVATADVDVALHFVDAVEAASRRVSKNPGLGSPRFAYELSIPGLRATTVGKFPYVLFYVEREDVVDVWRLLHTSRDIPATLQDSDD
jgi:toxin ParE1/3/4